MPGWISTVAPAPTASNPPDCTVTFWPRVVVIDDAASVRDVPEGMDRAAVGSLSERALAVVLTRIVPTPALLMSTSSPLPGTPMGDQLFWSPQLRVLALPV